MNIIMIRISPLWIIVTFISEHFALHKGFNELPRSKATGYQTPSFYLVCYAAEMRLIKPKED